MPGGGRQTVSHHVADHERHRAVRQGEHVVPVASDWAAGEAGPAAGAELEPGDPGQAGRAAGPQ